MSDRLYTRKLITGAFNHYFLFFLLLLVLSGGYTPTMLELVRNIGFNFYGYNIDF